jgi:hypothetical protein
MTDESSDSAMPSAGIQWRRRNTQTSRASDRQVQVIFAIAFAAVDARLAYQLLSL